MTDRAAKPPPQVVFSDAPSGDDDELRQTLAALQRNILLNPLAAQALFSSLVAEGRRFSETPDGERWRQRLAGSELIGRSRILWDAMTLRGLEDDEDVLLPSAVIEAFVKAASGPDMERLLQDLFRQGVGGERP